MPFFGGSLFHEDKIEKIRTVLSEFPAMSLINLEFRLDKNDARVDTNILVRRSEIPLLQTYLHRKKGPAYEALLKWCSDWDDPDLPFRALIPHIWIMFDVDPESSVQQSPWVIISFSKMVLEDATMVTLIKKIAPYFANHITDEYYEILENLYEAKPPSGILPAIGFQNRQPHALRTGVKPFHSFDEIEQFLNKINWCGDIDKIRNAYSSFIEMVNFTMLSLTFNESLFDDLGIECWLRLPNDKNQISTILDKLVHMDLCSETKKEELMSLIRKVPVENYIWDIPPQEEISKSQFYINMLISEIKLLYSPANGLSAKAYFYFEKKESE